MLLEQKQLESSEADRVQRSTDTQKQVDAVHYNEVRAECIFEEKRAAQELEDFINTCRLPSVDACLASEAGKLLVSGLGEQAIQKCIDRKR